MLHREPAHVALGGPALDAELERMQDSVARARHNRWHGGDLVADGFDGLLAAVTNRAPLAYTARLALVPTWEKGRNCWQEDHGPVPGSHRSP